MRTAHATQAEPALHPDLRQTYEAHFTHVWHTLRRLGVRDSDLEDAAHDVFVVVHRRLPDFDVARPIRPWLTGITYRVASDERRRARHRRERSGMPDGVPESADSGPSPEEVVAARQARAAVLAALDTLDMERRVVFVMHELDGVSGPEIAEALAVPLNTVYSRLRIARSQFAAAVRRQRLRRSDA